MQVPPWLNSLSGTAWAGTSNLWLDPPQPPTTGDITASVDLVAGRNAALIRYSWSFDGTPQEGILVVGTRENGEAEASWLDSFHMSDIFMISKGRLGNGDRLSVLGSYASPPGPDWGWRTEIEKSSAAAWRIRMYNITPDGEETPSFEVILGV